MNVAYILFGVALAALVGAFVWRWVAERLVLEGMSVEERHEHEMTKAFGARAPQLFCQHCQSKGGVRSREFVRQEHKTIQTGNLVRPTHETSVSVQVTQRHCDLCSTKWDV